MVETLAALFLVMASFPSYGIWASGMLASASTEYDSQSQTTTSPMNYTTFPPKTKSQHGRRLLLTSSETKDLGPWRSPEYRVLVHCLQSSGCSYFAAVLSQSPTMVTAVDVAVNSRSVPDSYEDIRIRGSEVTKIAVAKVVVWGVHQIDPLRRLKEMKDKLRPHATILFVRHPEDNLLSLRKHLVNKRKGGPGYARSKGEPNDKLQALEQLFTNAKNLFDATVYYGDLFYARAEVVNSLQTIGIPIQHCDFCVPNNMRDLMTFSKQRLKYGSVSWGGGGIHGLAPASEYKQGHRNSDSAEQIRQLCPVTQKITTARDEALLRSAASNVNHSFSNVEGLIGTPFLRWCKSGQCPPQKPIIPKNK